MDKYLSKYPLSCRLFDLSDNCNSVLYGMTVGDRRVYRCGRYNRSGGAVCNNNQVDGEAMLRFVLQTLRRMRHDLGTRDELRKRLEAIAKRSAVTSPVPEKEEITRLRHREPNCFSKLDSCFSPLRRR